MDIKAMAKSKRSHTRHHQPHKPHRPKPPTQPSSNPKPPNRNQPRDLSSGPQPPPPPSLPSNWSRYDSDDDDGEEEQQRVGVGSAKEGPLVVKPKSEGADFRHLLAQAKESQSHYVPPSFDQSLPDLYQGLGPMLAARGESILPWDGGDDFLGEDEGTTLEAPFFKLDLQALAEQLEKVDLAKRLFIEEDLLPPELRAPESKEADDHRESLRKLEEQKSTTRIDTFHELFSLYLEAEKEAEMENEAKTNPETPSVAAHVTHHNLDNLTILDDKETPAVGHIPGKDTPSSSRFEAATAEAELDVLLDSFHETKFFDSSSTSKGSSATGLAPSKPSLHPSTSEFNDTLDDLLEETSKGDYKDCVFRSDQGQASGFDDTLDDLLEETSKASYKDGVFRSDRGQASGFDDALDDLLEETSKGGYKDGVFRSDGGQASGFDDDLDKLLEETSKLMPAVSSESKPKELEDFDTWFDKL